MGNRDQRAAPDDIAKLNDIVNDGKENRAMNDQFKPTPDNPFDDEDEDLAADDDLEFDNDFSVEDSDDDDLVADADLIADDDEDDNPDDDTDLISR